MSNDPVSRIFMTYHWRLYWIAMLIINEPTVAEDIVSSVFDQLLTSKDLLRRPETIRKYLYLAVKAESFAYRKSRLERLAAEREFAFAQFEVAPAQADNPQEEMIDRIYKALRILPCKCRRVWELILSDKKTGEISTILNISKKTVLAHKRNGILKLRAFLTGKNGS